MAEQAQPPTDESVGSPRRISVLEIAGRLTIGRLAVYSMLEQGIIPGVRLGRRWIITRHAYLTWERTCGMATGLQRRTEHKVT
jgi:excisionase family DNA binding protein